MRDLDGLLAEGYLANLHTFHALHHALQLTPDQGAAACLVSSSTYRRWLRTDQPSPTAVRLLAILAGHMPWADWSGWVMHRGLLYPPGFSRHGISPGDISALPFLRQLLGEYERQVREFNAMADQAETCRERPTGGLTGP